MADADYYSVEWVDEHFAPYGAWNQFAVTDKKWLADFYYFEMKLRRAFSPDYKYRIRVLDSISTHPDPRKPCKGQNINVCVAEGCFNEACLTL